MPASRRTTLARRAVAAVALVAGAGGAGACSSPEEPEPEPAPRPSAASTTPLSAYDTSDHALARRDPCAAMSAEVVEEVLGAEPAAERAWAPGQRLPGTPEIGDEWGCSLTAGDVTASAWVFAAPVHRPAAQGLVAEVTGQKCRRLKDAGTFGDPGVAFTCELNAGTTLSGRRGLVGTTWVSCEVSGDADQGRVERWCAGVLDSLVQT